MKKFFWILFLLTLFLFLTHDRLLGMAFERRLEETLSHVFGMRVSMEGLRIRLLPSKVSVSRLTFDNQPEFAPLPHLDARGLSFDIDFLALRQKEVAIRRVRLREPFYLIDRIQTNEGPRNNVVTWWRHIKSKKKKTTQDTAPPGRKWHVSIGSIELEDATFIFQDRSSEAAEKRFVFERLYGYLGNFVWPSPNPSLLSQEIKLRGMIGEHYPAPFQIEGRANFATSKVSFNLLGRIEEGLLVEYKRFWDGLSIQIMDGTFELTSRTICLRKELQSYNDLILKSPKVVAGSSATDKFFGLPMTAAIGFLQNQEKIHLHVQVRGNISDPEFGFQQAFRAAFQEALVQKTRSGVALITQGTSKLATQTAQVVQGTPLRLASSLGKMVRKAE